MSYNFLIEAADNMIESIVNSMKRSGSLNEVIELKSILKTTGVSYSDFFKSIKETNQSKFISSVLSLNQNSEFDEVIDFIISGKDKDIYSKCLNFIVDEDFHGKERLEAAQKIIEIGNQYNVLNQDEKNATLTDVNALRELFVKTGFYKINDADVNNISRADELMAKIDFVEDFYEKNKKIPNNIGWLLISVQSNYSDKFKNRFLIDALYAELKDSFGDAILFSRKKQSYLGANIEDVLTLDDETHQPKRSIAEQVSLLDIARHISGVNFLENERIYPSYLSYLSIDASCDYINSIFESYKNDKVSKDVIEKGVTYWLDKYTDSVLFDSENKFLKPIHLLLDSMDKLSIENKVDLNLGNLSSLINLVEDKCKVGDEAFNQVLDIYHRVLTDVVKSESPNVNFAPMLPLLKNTLNYKDISLEEKEDFFINILSGFIKSDKKVTVLKFLTMIDHDFVANFLNKEEPAINNKNWLSEENLNDKTNVMESDLRFDLSGYLMMFATDTFNSDTHHNSNSFNNADERKKLIDLAFSCNSFLVDVKTKKIGNSLFFTKMLKNPLFAEDIVSAVAKNMSNPLVQDFLELKSFREAMSSSRLESAYTVLMKMQIEKKIQKSSQENNDNGNSISPNVGDLFKL